MNSGVYRYLCLFSLLLAQFVYPPQGNAQSSINIPPAAATIRPKQKAPPSGPQFIQHYDQGKGQGID